MKALLARLFHRQKKKSANVRSPLETMVAAFRDALKSTERSND